MAEEVLEMGAKPKRTRAKSITREELDAMFAKHDEELTKRIGDMCDTCSHHECECPRRLDELGERSEARMDRLDENDELLRGKINELADITSDAFDRMHKEVEQNTKGLEFAARVASETNQYMEDLSTKLDEEHRLRELSEKRLDELLTANDNNSKTITEQKAKLEDYERTLRRNSGDVLRLGVLAGICLGVALIVLAVFLAG